jgi:hypothetical protein
MKIPHCSENENLLQADILAQPFRRRVQHKFQQHLVKIVNLERKAPDTLSLCTGAN